MCEKITSKNAVLFACTFIGTLLLLVFDAYCRTEVVTDVLFINISGLKFHRMEFVSIIFSLAFLIGAVLEKLFKHSKGFACFAMGVLAIFTAVFAMLNTDLFQLLFPTMRISHVTMSLSRILGILAGVSGIPVGVGIEYAWRGKTNGKIAAAAVIVSAASDVFMQSTGLYRIGFLLSAIIVLICIYITEVKNDTEAMTDVGNKRIAIKEMLMQFLIFTSVTVLVLITPRFLLAGCGLNYISVFLIIAVVLTILFGISDLQKVSLFGFSGMFVGSIFHYIIVHFVYTMTEYSGNRVIYYVPAYLFSIVLFVTVAICVIYKLSEKPRRKIK